ncbi:hypothetical protein ACQKPE_11215 [Pseudomonas sp. NPDC089554]|uniref:hypothetical protein n=1 Tax=Pseudomonas sp. NPDC089554 TaxID=3390653 RepID=UPI003CFCD1C4
MVFPIAFMANTFAMMLVMIGLSLFGKPGLAADFGLIHGATVALFYSFSGNARSLILAESEQINAAGILRLRLILLLPLGVVAWMLCAPVVDGGALFVLLLVLRRATEWVAEIFLSEQELKHQHYAAMRFLFVQGGLSLALLVALLVDGPLALPAIVAWAFSPLLVCLGKGFSWGVPGGWAPLLASVRLLLPHFGSTVVIGVSVYVFRLFILLVADKHVAGDLFSAFALGGILGAVFSQALGPTLVRHERQGAGGGRLQRLFALLLMGMMLAGLMLIAGAWLVPDWFEWTHKSQLFWLAVGCSLVGGVVMVLAQRIRLRILQSQGGGDVFGSDMLSNLLLVSCIPFLFYGVGVQALSALYLVGALLSWVFYASERRGLLPQIGVAGRAQHNALLLIALAIFLPLFFQFSGGIFDDPSSAFSSGGVLSLLPIPFSVIACYLSILLLGGYSTARLALLSLFFVFIGMLLTSLLLGLNTTGDGRQKLILLFQFILPMFALVLGQQYGNHEKSMEQLAKAARVVLLVIVPLQLLVTVLHWQLVLSPSVYFFSIYQHLLYVPVLFVGLYLLAIFTQAETGQVGGGLYLLALLMGTYVTLSWSVLAGGLLVLGTGCFVIQQISLGRRLGTQWKLPLLSLCGVLLAALYMGLAWQVEGLKVLSGTLGRVGTPPEGGVGYPERWGFYIEGIGSSWGASLLGHEQAPARALHPSALNYYLDFAYNFGLIGLLSLVVLVVYSGVVVSRQWQYFRRRPAIIGLTLVVFFMLLVDSTFKVGLRQPYSGVIMFFLWGVLLAMVVPSNQQHELNNKN